MLFDHLKAKLAEIESQDKTRHLRVMQGATATRQAVLRRDGRTRELLMFCSNDYLGLASHPALVQALQEGIARYGAGAGASHLISGHGEAHQRLDDTLSGWYREHIPQARALGFSSGYMANIAVMSSLGDRDTDIFSEHLNHASLIDGMRLSRATVRTYPHADTAALGGLLAASRARIKLIVTDAVFSMDGDLAPLQDILALADAHDAWLVVDDAHGFGVLGTRGRGALEHLRLRSERLILIGTLSKAAGLSGAFVVAHETVTEYLLQTARTYIFTTAPAPALAHALFTSLALIEGSDGRACRAHLTHLQRRLREGLHKLIDERADLGWRLPPSDSPVQPLVVGDNATALRLSALLEDAGLRVPGIRHPTVPEGTARLRITLCANHSVADVELLLAALRSSAEHLAARAVRPGA